MSSSETDGTAVSKKSTKSPVPGSRASVERRQENEGRANEIAVLQLFEKLVAGAAQLQTGERSADLNVPLVLSPEESIDKFFRQLQTVEKPGDKGLPPGWQSDPEVVTALAARNTLAATNKHQFKSSLQGAEANLRTQLASWASAGPTYLADEELAIETAIQTARTAVDLYVSGTGDSVSRKLMRFFALEETVATAVGTYGSSDAAAIENVLGVLTTTVEAYATYRGTVQKAASELLNAEATAENAYWEAVHTAVDP